jgi:hypothetical protein
MKKPKSNPGKVLYNGSYLVGREHPRGMIITATEEGREYAQEEIDNYPALFDMFEDWIGNGWMWIPPESVGALTDGEIISPDAYMDDYGEITFPYPNSHVYWFSNYQVENPLETWAEGKGVIFDVSEVSSKKALKAKKISNKNPADPNLKTRLMR